MENLSLVMMIASQTATFTLREALGRPVHDRSGAPWGTLADLSLGSPERPYLDLVMDDEGPCVVPGPTGLAFDRRILRADLADLVRLRGERDTDELRLAADLLGKRVVVLESGRIARVRDVRLVLANGHASPEAVLLGPVRRVALRSWGWVDWAGVIALDAIRAGRGLPHHRRRLAEMTSDQRESLISGLERADAESLRSLF
jgi:hypothetical protein